MEIILINLIKFYNQLRILHWQTKSYSQHIAFGDAFNTLVELVDGLVETYQGKYGHIRFKDVVSIELVNDDELSIMDVLDEVTLYLSSSFNAICNSETDTDILNIRDEILASVNKLKYLLTLN